MGRSMKALGTVTAAALAAGLTALPAAANERDNTKNEPFSYIEERCAFDLAVDGVINGNFVVRQDRSGQAFLVLDRVNYRSTLTNADTGRSFTIEARNVFHEISAEQVDGNVYRFRVVLSGQQLFIRDGQGRPYGHSAGSSAFTYLFDTLGDGQPGGVWLPGTEVVEREETGRNTHPEDSLCDIATALTM